MKKGECPTFIHCSKNRRGGRAEDFSRPPKLDVDRSELNLYWQWSIPNAHAEVSGKTIPFLSS